MKKRKLKKYVLPACYLIVVGLMAFSITLLSKNLLDNGVKVDEHYNYTMSVFNESDTPTNDETQEESITIQKPFSSDKVSVAKEFYSKDDTTENQANALIFYENTYMPNTGILYESDEVFDCLAVADGTIKDIKTDEILGNVITVENTSKLTTVYYTSGETTANVGDKVKMGDVITKSGESKLQTDKKQTLLFETYMDGVLVNPTTIFDKDIAELN